MPEIVMPRLSDSMEEGDDPDWLKQVGRRGRGRRGDRRDRDRQGEHGLRGRRRRDSDRDPGARRATRWRSAARSRWSGSGTARDRALSPRVRTAGPRPKPGAPRPCTRGAEASRRRLRARRAGRRAGQGVAAGQAAGAGERASTSRRSRAPAPAGGSSRLTWKGRCRSAAGTPTRQPSRQRRECPRPRARLLHGASGETAKGETTIEELTRAAAGGRPADGGVQGDGAALLPADRDRHDPGGGGAGTASRPRRRGRGRALLQRHGGQGLRAGAAGSSRSPTAPTGTGASSSTRGSTSASPSPRRTRWSCRRVFDADRKGLREIAAETRALAAKVRDGSITPPELSGGTFTVSNLGMYGITELLRRDQLAAGGDPRGRGDRREAGRARGRDHHRPADGASPSPATTASSTAPTPPSSSPGSGRCSRSRSRWRSERVDVELWVA